MTERLVAAKGASVFRSFRGGGKIPFSTCLAVRGKVIVPSFMGRMLRAPYPIYNERVRVLLGKCTYGKCSRGSGSGGEIYGLCVPGAVTRERVPLRTTRVLTEKGGAPFVAKFGSERKGSFSSQLILARGLSVSFSGALYGYPGYKKGLCVGGGTCGYSGCEGRTVGYSFIV